MLNILYGRAGSGKTHFCIEGFINSLKEKGQLRSCIIVPEQFSLQTERTLLNANSNMNYSVIGNEVLSFKRLAYRLINQYGGAACTHLDKPGRIILLTSFLRKLRAEHDLSFFSSAAEDPQEASRLLGLFDELEKYNVTTDVLSRIMDNIEERSSLYLKLNEIKKIYTVYKDNTLNLFPDENDIYKKALEHLSYYKPFQDGTVWIDGFTGFTPLELDTISILLQQCKNVFVTLTLDFDGRSFYDPVFAFTGRTYHQLCEIADSLMIQRVLIKATDHCTTSYINKKSPELCHLEKNYYAYPYEKYAGTTENITVTECETLLEEVSECAKNIKALLNKGCRHEDILVIINNPQEYSDIIKTVFLKEKLSYFTDSTDDISGNPLCSAIISLLDTVVENWSFESVITLIKSGLILSFDQCDMVEKIAIEKGLNTRYRWIAEKEGLFGIVGFLDTFYHSLKDCRDLAKVCDALSDFISSWGLEQIVNDKINSFLENNLEDSAKEYKNIYEDILSVISRVREFLGDQPVKNAVDGAKQMRIYLACGFAQYKVGFVPYSTEVIHITDVERARSHKADWVFVLGANDGIIPPTFIDNGLLNDSERGRITGIKDLKVELADDTKMRIQKNVFNIYSIYAMPQKGLFVSYPLMNNASAELRQSFVAVKKLLMLFPDIKITIPDKGKKNTTLTLDFKEEHHVPTSLAKTLHKCEDTLELDISRVQNYNRCPYEYLLKYGLGLNDIKSFELTFADIGNIMHNIIDIATKGILKGLYKRADEDIILTYKNMTLKDGEDVIETVCAQLLEQDKIPTYRHSSRTRFLFDRLKSFTKKAFNSIVHHITSGKFNVLYCEVPFGEGEGSVLPPIKINVPDFDVTVNVKGRIDRVDRHVYENNDLIRIIDYKSSAKTLNREDVEKGINIQLPVYAKAFSQKFENGKICGLLYFTFDDDITKESDTQKPYVMKGAVLDENNVINAMVIDEEGNVSCDIIPLSSKGGGLSLLPSVKITENEMEDVCNMALDTVEKTCFSILDGDYPAIPAEISKESFQCKYCDYSSICGKKRG